MRRRRALACLCVLACAGAAPADTPYETTIEDLDEQDRRYLERLERAEEAAEEPAPSREEVVAEFVGRAEELIRDRNFAFEQTEHYRIATDDPRVALSAVGSLLESFHAFFERSWSKRAELVPREDRARVYLFWSYSKFHRLMSDNERFGEFRPSGHYRRFFDVLSIHTDAGAPDDLPDLIVHEAAHQLVEQRLFAAEGTRSLWVTEGLATYYGHMERDEDGTFVPSRIGGKAIRLLREGRASSRPPSAGAKLRESRRAFRDRSWSLETLMRTRDPAVFYGAGLERHYAVSWSLVHFLFHGDEGAHAEAFVRYLRLEARGEGGAEALLREIGLDLATLESKVADHLGRMRG